MKVMKTPSNIVGLKELRLHTEKYIREVKKGRTITVVRRSEPIFKISPPEDDESMWETVVDFTKIDPQGVSAKEVLKRLKTLRSS